MHNRNHGRAVLCPPQMEWIQLMNDRDQYRYDRATRIQTFGDDNAAYFAAGGKAATLTPASTTSSANSASRSPTNRLPASARKRCLTRFGAVLCVAAMTGSAFAAADPLQIRTCTEFFADGGSRPPKLQAADSPACLWKKRTLTVRFLEGDPVVQEKVERYAQQWTNYSGVTFVFGATGAADIRISFRATGPKSGSWSYVGSCRPDLSPDSPTMNFGWLNRATDDSEYSRVVLHEFGHGLGLIHEHESPAAGIKWNEEAVYAYYAQQGWDRENTRHNVLEKYQENESNHTAYDPHSIMQYPIPPGLTLDGFTVGWNTELSPLDKQFVREQYGGRSSSLDSPSAAALTQATHLKDPDLGVSIHYQKQMPSLLPERVMEPRADSALKRPATLPAVAQGSGVAAAADDEGMGKLEAYITYNPSVQRAKQFRFDPGFEKLPAAQKNDFLQEWGLLMFSKAVPSRDLLIDEARPLDEEQKDYAAEVRRLEQEKYDIEVVENDLEYRFAELKKQIDPFNVERRDNDDAIAKHNVEVKSHESAIAAYNGEVSRYPSECLGGPLDPGPYQRCVAWKNALDQRAAQLNARSENLTREAAVLNRKRSELDIRAGLLNKRRNELLGVRDALEQRRTKYAADVKHVEDWTVTLNQSWDFEKKRIEAWIVELDKFNAKLAKALGAH